MILFLVEVYPYINGPTIVIDTTAYNLDYLPERWNVTWQLSPASSFVALQTLPNDSLGRPLCMLTKDIRYPYDGYIQAILYRNNDSITTVSKKIYGHLAMGKAYYVVRKYPSNQVIDAALIPPGNIIKYIKVGDILNYSSPNFKGMRGEEDVWHGKDAARVECLRSDYFLHPHQQQDCAPCERIAEVDARHQI